MDNEKLQKLFEKAPVAIFLRMMAGGLYGLGFVSIYTNRNLQSLYGS